VENAAIISGYSAHLPFAGNSVQLIEHLRQGKRVERKPWFRSDDEAITCGFNGNKYVARLEHINDGALEIVYQLIEEALAQAKLDTHSLAGNNVRVYLTGLGSRVDGIDYHAFYDRNDVEDIKLTRSLTRLHVSNMSQDTIACSLAQKYQLQYLPPNMNCTSNSSLTAVHLGCQAIEQGGIDLVVVINCSKIKTQDIWFLDSQSMLDSEVVQPFGENSKGVLFSEGFSVVVLESLRHRRDRDVTGGVRLQSSYAQISAGRSNDASWLSLNVLKIMRAVTDKAGVNVQDLCAIIPHGNGSSVSDKAEAKAIEIFADAHVIPVLAYKGQIGYCATGSGIIDLIIAHHSLTQRELIAPVSNDAILDVMAPFMLIDRGVCGHEKNHLLKVGVGVDGSVIGIVLSAINPA